LVFNGFARSSGSCTGGKCQFLVVFLRVCFWDAFLFEFTPLLDPFQIHFGRQNHLKNDAKTGTVFREEKKRPILKKTRKKAARGVLDLV
jgi:hypothetical protein